MLHLWLFYANISYAFGLTMLHRNFFHDCLKQPCIFDGTANGVVTLIRVWYSVSKVPRPSAYIYMFDDLFAVQPVA